MAMQGFFSQMLGHGAGKSMADYNKQQQINELLRQGWVPKGQGGGIEEGMPSAPEDSMRDTEQPDVMQAIVEAAQDPEIAKLINEMSGVGTSTEGADRQTEVDQVFGLGGDQEEDYSGSYRFPPSGTGEGYRRPEVKRFDAGVGTADSRMAGTMNDMYATGKNLLQQNLNPVNIKYLPNSVANKYAAQGPDGLPLRDEHNHLIFDTEESGWAAAKADITAKMRGNSKHGLGPNSTLDEFGAIYATDPLWSQKVSKIMGPDVMGTTPVGQLNEGEFVEAIARQEGWYAESGSGFQSPFEDSSGLNQGRDFGPDGLEDDPDYEANPDPVSRMFVKREFAEARKKLDGFSPSKSEAGSFLKPIAEQLNAMFGSSTPLDMDGYEMGPYHAQRIAVDKMNREDERHQKGLDQQQRQLDVLKQHYGNLNDNARATIEQKTLTSLLKYQTDIRKFDEDARIKINSGDIPTPKELEALDAQERDLVEDLFEMINDTGFAEFTFGTGAVIGQFGTIDKDDGLDGIMPTLYLMMGLNEDGSMPDDASWYNRSELFKQSDQDIRNIQQAIETIEYIRALRRDTPGWRYQGVMQAEPEGSMDGNREGDFIKELTPYLRNLLTKHNKTDPLKTRVGEK